MARLLTLAEISADTGYGRRWVLKQIELGRLFAIAYDAGGRRSYRVPADAYALFRITYLHDSRELPRRQEG